jgi:hypothetical protein
MRWNGKGNCLYSVNHSLCGAVSECVNSHSQTGGQVGRIWQDEVVREANGDQNGARGLLQRTADMLDTVQRASPFLSGRGIRLAHLRLSHSHYL